MNKIMTFFLFLFISSPAWAVQIDSPVVRGNMGIGTGATAPGSALTVIGGIAGAITAGDPYATTAAPSGGAMYEGNVLIGTTTAAVTGLTLVGAISVTGNTSVPAYVTGVNFGVGTSTPVAQLDARTGVRLGSVRYVTSTVVTTSGGSLTLTAANMAKNSIFQETGSTAATFTLDTGANLSAAIPGTVQVGDTIWFVVSNASSQTITMAGATGTTLANTMTVITLQSRTFYAICTGTNTWTIY